ncbi:MAG: hypothetical protein HY395_00245 [Candidatus Doudnabacteria bacterium]|nr:hypothetical protein [Candidatus Doudnabacteria bacterium]
MTTLVDRVNARSAQGWTGSQIALELLEEKVTVGQAADALIQNGFVAVIEDLTSQAQMLHVSDKPVEPGIRVIIAEIRYRNLPALLWGRT